MNYLGHLYLSENNHELMLNNLFGDFVKGKDLSLFPEKVQEGILLHRKIDSYIDNHELVKDLRTKLYQDLPKITNVAIDLYVDHLLAKNWIFFHTKPLAEFLAEFYQSIDLDKKYFTKEFQIMIERLLQYNWIKYYASIEGLDKMCKGVSKRISFPNKLVNGQKVFLQNEELITNFFYDFMRALNHDFSVCM